MRKFHLIDIDHDSGSIHQEHLYQMASQMVLKYGCLGDKYKRYTQESLREFWKYDEPLPSIRECRKSIRVSAIKWYIHNKVVVNESIWNSDFLHGVIAHCKVSWHKFKFPSCAWCNNEDLTELLKTCPYGGRFVFPDNASKWIKWVEVPALYLNFSEDSISFMAGIMAGTRLVIKDGNEYAQFNNMALPYFKKWGIPIEFTKIERRYYISPLWPALFAKYMPEDVAQKWLNLKKPYGVDLYAPLLWKIYVDSNFPVDGIPYLQSRRKIFYDYECEEGAMKKLDQLRVGKNLTVLDNRIRIVVQQWARENK